MANPELSQRIQELPEELLGLEREPGIAERLRRIDALKDRARALDPLDGVEDMALADYDRDWLVRYTYNSITSQNSSEFLIKCLIRFAFSQTVRYSEVQ